MSFIKKRAFILKAELRSYHLCDFFNSDLVVSRVLLSQSPGYKTEGPLFDRFVSSDLKGFKLTWFTVYIHFLCSVVLVDSVW